MKRWIFNFFAIIILAVAQTSFLSVLPFFQYFHPILLYVIYISIKRGGFLPTAILGGYIMDIYSSYSFGLHIAAIAFAAAFANYIYFNILTSRRFFTVVILTAASIFMYHMILFAGIAILSFLKLSPKTNIAENFDLRNIGIEIFSVSSLASAAYFIYYHVRKKLSLRLLIKNYAPR